MLSWLWMKHKGLSELQKVNIKIKFHEEILDGLRAKKRRILEGE